MSPRSTPRSPQASPARRRVARCRRPRGNRRAGELASPHEMEPGQAAFDSRAIAALRRHVAASSRRCAARAAAAWCSTWTTRCGAASSAMTASKASCSARAMRPAKPISRAARCARAARARRRAGGVVEEQRRRRARCRSQNIPRCCCARAHRRVPGELERQGDQHRAIAAELSLGLDSMVFLDDNPVERGLVRELLPEVAVPELPDDPALYARTLAAAGYFETVAFSDEDRKRAGFYQDNARRVALQKQVGDVDDVSGLAGHGASRSSPFDATGRSAHRAADQQVEPVQPDDPALHRGRSRGARSGSAMLHAAGAADRHASATTA